MHCYPNLQIVDFYLIHNQNIDDQSQNNFSGRFMSIYIQ